ncbi:MAG: hypothetical protein ACP5OG_03975 [Candidatus Nanoarchaeia archaeon]
MGDADNIIAGVSPDKNSENKLDLKKIIKKQGYDSAIKDAKPKPAVEYKLIYNSPTETLEPVYFWILDFMNGMFKPKNVTKLADNFASSPGSGHFADLRRQASTMQQEASRVLGTVNSLLKGIINLIYDLKEFQIRLSNYDAAKSKDKQKAEAGNLALKQIWMDKVDVQRGIGSINGMTSGNLQFVTLRDAFMASNTLEEIDKLDLNERVIRILKPRLQEFIQWKDISEKELRKRYEVEKLYLKSQVDALKLNTRWAKPYLKAAQQLEMNDKTSSNPALVNIFNTLILELTLMGKTEVSVEDEALDGRLPKEFIKMKNLRKYYSVVIVDLNFVGIPSRFSGQGPGSHYAFGGRAEVTFKAYTMNEDELMVFEDRLNKSDLNDALKLVEGMTEGSLAQIKADIDEILGSEEKEKKQEEVSDLNPFTALFSFVKNEKKVDPKDAKKQKLKELNEKKIKEDNFAEKYIRSLAEAVAINNCFTIYDIYKKSHGMAAFPYRDEEEPKPPKTSAEELFGF